MEFLRALNSPMNCTLPPIFEENVHPILRSRHDFSSQHFYSADLAIRGQGFSNKDWEHPPTSNAVGWVKHAATHLLRTFSLVMDPDNTQSQSSVNDWKYHNMGIKQEAHDWAQNRFQESGTFA